MSKRDLVNHPPHYKSGDGLETIDVIESFDLGFRDGNAIKYILRAGKKAADSSSVTARHASRIEDLKKAQWYIAREIADYERRAESWRRFDARIVRDKRRAAAKKRRVRR